MIKRILNLMRQDFVNVLRDNMIFYMIIGPALFAFAMKAFLPSLNDAKINIVIDNHAEEAVLAKIESYGSVTYVDSRDAVVERVERNDDVLGIAFENGNYEVILEGNESEGEEIAEVLMLRLLSDETFAEYNYTFETEVSQLLEYGAVILIMMAIIMGTLLSGLNVVHDKETGAIKALSVSPLSMAEFWAARIAFAFILGYIQAIISIVILLGSNADYGAISIGYLLSFGVVFLLSFIIGGITDNQVQAMSLVKILAWLYLSVPIISIFVSRSWHFLFYILPNYWMFLVFENIFVGQVGNFGFWPAALITLVSSMLLSYILYIVLRRKMSLN